MSPIDFGSLSCRWPKARSKVRSSRLSPSGGSSISYSTQPALLSLTRKSAPMLFSGHARIVDGHQRGEVADTFLMSTVRELTQQHRAQPPTLAFIDDGDSHLGSL